jgi:3-deoxy-7-phosphoheptulonate synthase
MPGLSGKISNLHIKSFDPIESPNAIKKDVPLAPEAAETVLRAREEIRRALRGTDPRLLVIVGPCSIHDPDAAMDYAGRLARLSREVRGKMIIVMRFEKPRTIGGRQSAIRIGTGHTTSTPVEADAVFERDERDGVAVRDQFLDQSS